MSCIAYIHYKNDFFGWINCPCAYQILVHVIIVNIAQLKLEGWNYSMWFLWLFHFNLLAFAWEKSRSKTIFSNNNIFLIRKIIRSVLLFLMKKKKLSTKTGVRHLTIKSKPRILIRINSPTQANFKNII